MLSVLILIPFWNRFGTVLGAKISFGGILGASWKSWEHLGSTSGQSWGMLGMRGGIVAASWQHLGTILGAFWMTWEHPGSTLGPSWTYFGSILGVSCMLGSILGSLMPCWIDFGCQNESKIGYVCIFVLGNLSSKLRRFFIRFSAAS